MRDTRLTFYRDDVERINGVLREFLKLSGAKSTILVDKEGHTVTEVGKPPSFELDTIAALVAASFMATKELARILGEGEFAILTHQGKTDHLQLNLVADRCILTTMFDTATTIGMVRLYATEATKKLNKLFAEIALRKDAPPGENLAEDYTDQAKSALDDVFG